MMKPKTLRVQDSTDLAPPETGFAGRLFKFADEAGQSTPEAYVLGNAADFTAFRSKLLVVDSDSRNRGFLAALAASIGCDVETYANAQELMTSGSKDGLVLANDAAGRGSALEVIAAIADARQSWPVIAMADEPDLAQAVAAIKAGAIDYVATPRQTEALMRTILLALPEAKAKRAANTQAANAWQRIALLSRRERDVLTLLVTGTTNKQMGRDLGISPRTVEIHRMKVLAKLGTGNAQQATMLHILAFGLAETFPQ